MIKDSKVISFVVKDDYVKLGGNFMASYYKASLDGEVRGWTIDSTTGIVTSKSSDSYGNYLRPSLGFLKVGDKIEFEGEFAKVGHDVMFLLEYSVNENMSGLTWEEGITVITGLSDSLEMKSFTLNIKKDGYYRLYIGCYQNSPSEFKMRNVGIKINSVKMVNPFVKIGNWTPSISGVTSNALGTYTLIDNKVTIKAQLSISNKGTNTGAIVIGGLPFVPKTGQSNYGQAEVTNATLTTGYTRLYTNLALGNAMAYIRKTGNGLNNTFLTFEEISNTSEIFLEITYEI